MKNKDSSIQQNFPIINISDDGNEEIDLTEENKDLTLNNSVIKVIFKEEKFFKRYKSEIEQFLNNLLEKDENFVTEHEFKTQEQSFHIDNVQDDGPISMACNGIPLYSTSYEEMLHVPEPEVEETKTEKKPQGMTCFNCLGDHHMKDCLEKQDRQRIAANKKEMLLGNSSRYHIEEKKNAIKPGCPSSELRNALGLRSDQLPPYIYSMRVIGYPPGWMQEAVHETSGISLYDDSEKNSPSKSESTSMSQEKTQYEEEKLINYPGFNSPVPKKLKDEWNTLGWLPIQQHQQLSETLKQDNIISGNNIYKRKHLSSTSHDEVKKSKNGVCDVDESKSSWSPGHSSTPKNSNSLIERCDTKSPSSPTNLSLSLSKSPGTPIVGHGNPYRKLPVADKFAQDITEHLPFENLPDAVGKFDNMRNVISNVQKKLQFIKRS